MGHVLRRAGTHHLRDERFGVVIPRAVYVSNGGGCFSFSFSFGLFGIYNLTYNYSEVFNKAGKKQ